MTDDQFTALATLMRLRASPSREAVRLVLVDGMRQADAARAVGISASALGNAIRAAKLAVELVKVVVG